MTVTKEAAARYLVRYHHLTDDTELRDADIPEYVRKVGCIQFDPLDVVGYNSELVLQSRVAAYRRGDLETHLYGRKRLFDVWDKNMSICCVEDWPFFSRSRARMREHCDRFSAAIEAVSAHLRAQGCACSADFGEDWLNEKVSWYWGSHKLAKAALECMAYAGMTVVHHKKGTRRYFCLAEDFIPGELLAAPDPNETDEQYCDWLVARRIDSIGMLWNRGGDAWLGVQDFRSADREGAFARLEARGAIRKVSVEGVRHPFYLSAQNLPLLQRCIEAEAPPPSVRIIAPLDNIVWERRMLEEIFGLSYRWEVYVPQAKRQYGYYVLPVLCGARFVGRIEMRRDKRTDTLHILAFWWEKKCRTRGRVRAVSEGLARFAAYAGCGKIDYACKL